MTRCFSACFVWQIVCRSHIWVICSVCFYFIHWFWIYKLAFVLFFMLLWTMFFENSKKKNWHVKFYDFKPKIERSKDRAEIMQNECYSSSHSESIAFCEIKTSETRGWRSHTCSPAHFHYLSQFSHYLPLL